MEAARPGPHLPLWAQPRPRCLRPGGQHHASRCARESNQHRNTLRRDEQRAAETLHRQSIDGLKARVHGTRPTCVELEVPTSKPLHLRWLAPPPPMGCTLEPSFAPPIHGAAIRWWVRRGRGLSQLQSDPRPESMRVSAGVRREGSGDRKVCAPKTNKGLGETPPWPLPPAFWTSFVKPHNCLSAQSFLAPVWSRRKGAEGLCGQALPLESPPTEPGSDGPSGLPPVCWCWRRGRTQCRVSPTAQGTVHSDHNTRWRASGALAARVRALSRRYTAAVLVWTVPCHVQWGGGAGVPVQREDQGQKWWPARTSAKHLQSRCPRQQWTAGAVGCPSNLAGSPTATGMPGLPPLQRAEEC